MRINPSFQNFRGDDLDIFKKPDFTSNNYTQSKEDINTLWKRIVEEKTDIFEVMHEKRDSEDREELSDD